MSSVLSSQPRRQAPVVAVDVRWWLKSGIGRYLRELLPRVMSEWPEARWRLFGSQNSMSELAGAELVTWDWRKFDWREQMGRAPAAWRGADLRWVPHFNVTRDTAGPLAVTVHDVLPLVETGGWRGWLRARLARIYFSRVRRRAEVVFCPSHFTAQGVVEKAGVRASRVRVTPLGVDPSFGRVSRVEREAVWLYVGNIKPHKGLATLLDALARPVLANSGHRLAIVGRRKGFFTSAPELAKRAEALGARVIWVGEADEETLMAWYARAEALVLPSRHEGFGLPVLEAMAAGCPVVAAAAGALPEVGGEAAGWFSVGDAAGLAARLRELADAPELRRERAQAGRLRAREFTWERTAKLTAAGLRAVWEGTAP